MFEVVNYRGEFIGDLNETQQSEQLCRDEIAAWSLESLSHMCF